MAPSELRPVGLKCEYRVDPLGIDERVAEAELGARVGGDGTRCSPPTASWSHEARRISKRRRTSCGIAAGSSPAAPSASSTRARRCGRARAACGRYVSGTGLATLALQRSGRLRDGLAGEVGLGGSLDLRRQRPGRRHGAPVGRRVRRPGQWARPEPLPAQRIFAGQTSPQGTAVRDRPRRLRTVHKRQQGRRRRARPRLDGLRQAHPVPDLRRHAAARGGTERPRRHPRRRLVRRILRVRPQAQGRPLRSTPAASRAARRRVRGRHEGEHRDRRLVEMLDRPDPLLRPPHGRVLRRPQGDARLGRARLRRLRHGTGWKQRR